MCNTLSPCQYWFRLNIPTSKAATEALSDLAEPITTSLENNKHVVELIIDINEAFDAVDYDILFTQIQLCGVYGVAHKWI